MEATPGMKAIQLSRQQVGTGHRHAKGLRDLQRALHPRPDNRVGAKHARGCQQEARARKSLGEATKAQYDCKDCGQNKHVEAPASRWSARVVRCHTSACQVLLAGLPSRSVALSGMLK
eukprot:scaffold662_cov364-Pavlova_lutheri.AAC.59